MNVTLTAAILAIALCASPSPATTASAASLPTFELYPPIVPDHVAANETITPLELRIELPWDELPDPSTTAQLRITPMSTSVDFRPASLVFTHDGPPTQVLSLRARTAGTARIAYAAQWEIPINETALEVLAQVGDLAPQELDVLPPPVSYSVDDARWQGLVLLNDSFDETDFSVTTSPLWGRIRHGFPSGACGAADGPRALYFTALGDRFVATRPLELRGFHGKMHFAHLYGAHRSQAYDPDGDNRIACELVDPGEEVVFSFLPTGEDPLNASAWRSIEELALPPVGTRNETTTRAFTSYAIALPAAAMADGTRFRWQQKDHSSFPIDVAAGVTTTTTLLEGENDDTSVDGGLGITERELWHYRNLFDQWALDDVRLEVRLSPPEFTVLDPTTTITLVDDDDANAEGGASSNRSVSIGAARVTIDSPVHNTWVEFLVGDGTHAFPTCGGHRPGPDPAVMTTTTMNHSGYVHAIACLDVYGDGASIASSFPIRSPRILVQARAPTLTTTLDTSTSVDTWTIGMQCSGCGFLRYTTRAVAAGADAEAMEPGDARHLHPSCSFGTRINATTGTIAVNGNTQVFVVACGDDLVPSDIVESAPLVVAPRRPTFEFTMTETTITNAFNVTVHPPPGAANVGIAWTVRDSLRANAPQAPKPTCRGMDVTTIAGATSVVVRASDLITAVACCLDVPCEDSEASTWGPIRVKSVVPTFSMACSRVRPRTMLVRMTSPTEGAWVQYHVVGSALSSPPPALDCSPLGGLRFDPLGMPEGLEVAPNSTTVVAVSCLPGLLPSARTEIPVVLDDCCAGREAHRHPSCARVLRFHDDFGNADAGATTTTCLDPEKWSPVRDQWGGDDLNGGVHPANVQCRVDRARAKGVLELAAHGDLYLGEQPVGLKRLDDGALLGNRTEDDRLLEWALDGVSPRPCRPPGRCPARRVGAAVRTSLELNAGVALIRLRPCRAFGTLTQVWWGSYADNEAQIRGPVPFLPLWKAGMYQAPSTAEVAFVFSSPAIADASNDTTNSSIGSSSVVDQDTATGAFLELGMQWNASLGRANLYVDGELVHKQWVPAGLTTAQARGLAIGVWFPNALAGEPLFGSCSALVDEVQVFDAEITGERWCDFEPVAAGSVPCDADGDCADWVTRHCFMPIHEATCVIPHDESHAGNMGNATNTATTDPTADDDQLDEDDEPEALTDLEASNDDPTATADGAAAATDAITTGSRTRDAPQKRGTCHFRIEPRITAAYGTTEMTQRGTETTWTSTGF